MTQLQLPEVEKLVLMPLRNPSTGRSSTKFWYAGAVDRIEERRIVDWKSSSDPASFSAKKSVGFQPDCYALALRRMGYVIDEYEYRVVQNPAIKLCDKDYKAGAETLAKNFPGATPESAPAIHSGFSAEAYEERCLEWLSEPGRVISIIGPITDESVYQAECWLWAVKERIQLARKTGSRLTNESACDSFGSLCPYVKLCAAAKAGDDVASLAAELYAQKGVTHAELNLPAHVDQKNVITYSAAAKFSLCEQRHYWGYELGLELPGEETSQALYIGSAMHKGLEHLNSGLDTALGFIEEWRKENPVIGPDATHRQIQDIAKARAMVRAAARKWGADA